LSAAGDARAGRGCDPAPGRLGGAAKPDANNEPFRILMLARVRFARIGMKKKPTAPHARLVYIHLHSPSSRIIDRKSQE
jgi:hypothetical protein